MSALFFACKCSRPRLAYTLNSGLDLGVPAGYPTGNNAGTGGTGFPWAPANGGLRNITRVVNDGDKAMSKNAILIVHLYI
jgi:hypothetical protein